MTKEEQAKQIADAARPMSDDPEELLLGYSTWDTEEGTLDHELKARGFVPFWMRGRLPRGEFNILMHISVDILEDEKAREYIADMVIPHCRGVAYKFALEHL